MRRWRCVAVVVALVGSAVAGGPAAAQTAVSVGAGGIVFGTVVSATTGDAVVGEPVYVTLHSSPGTDEHQVTTDVDGSYQVELAYASVYDVYVGARSGGPSATIQGASTQAPVADFGYTYCPATAAVLGDVAHTSEVSCTPAMVDVERFWSPRFNNAHFFTTNQDEAQNIRANDSNWTYEGRAFEAFGVTDDQCSEGSPVFRFYSARFQSHFYTIDAAEKAAIIAGDRNWTYEGVAYCADTQAGGPLVPVYRFWSPTFGKHFYTVNQPEADHIIAVDRNWTYEGVAFYVLD